MCCLERYLRSSEAQESPHLLCCMGSGLILTRRSLSETDELRFLFPIISRAGKLGLVLRSVAQFIFGREFPTLAVVATFLLLTVSWLLLRHQQVEN